MDTALTTLETKLSENEKRLSAIKSEIASLMQEADIIEKNNEGLVYSIGLIKHPTARYVKRPITSVSSAFGKTDEQPEKQTLRAAVLDSIQAGEAITIGDTWERVKNLGFDTTRATINSTLYNLVKKGDLIQPETGLYKKAV